MDDRLTIPKTIRVGFDKRSDTYTGKLGYVVYVDKKGKTAKEKSWENWRDKTIDPVDYDNSPKDGFVLNRDVGGARRSYGWDARIEKVRVFDKEGFEFEISIPNLLFILQECSSIKGKGLEGEFVYAWMGSELILLPVSCPEYKNSVQHCILQEKKLTVKDIVPGCTYFTKEHKNVMYLGREMWYEDKWINGKGNQNVGKKRHIFVFTDIKEDKRSRYSYWVQDGFVKLATKTSETPVPQFAEEYDKLMKSAYTSKPKSFFVKDLSKNFMENDYRDYNRRESYCVIENGIYYMVSVNEHYPYKYDSEYKKLEGNYDIRFNKTTLIKDGEFVNKVLNQTEKPNFNRYGYGGYGNDRYIIDKASMDDIPKEMVNTLVKELWVECENGAKYRVGSF